MVVLRVCKTTLVTFSLWSCNVGITNKWSVNLDKIIISDSSLALIETAYGYEMDFLPCATSHTALVTASLNDSWFHSLLWKQHTAHHITVTVHKREDTKGGSRRSFTNSGTHEHAAQMGVLCMGPSARGPRKHDKLHTIGFFFFFFGRKSVF